MSNILLENISQDEIKLHLKQLYNFLKKKMPKIDRDPKVFFREDQTNANDFLGKTGYYDPDKEEIHLYITDRHGKDILRSFAHEVVHHEQKCSGMTSTLNLSITHMADYASKDSGLRNAEIDAFKRGNMLFRDWTDKLKAKRQKEKRVMNETVEEIRLRKTINSLLREVLTEKFSSKKKNKKKDPIQDAKELGKKHAREQYESSTGISRDDKEEDKTANMKETKNIPYQSLFESKKRVMNEAFTKRDNELFENLLKEFIK